MSDDVLFEAVREVVRGFHCQHLYYEDSHEHMALADALAQVGGFETITEAGEDLDTLTADIVDAVASRLRAVEGERDRLRKAIRDFEEATGLCVT